jgi:Xaa-Pro aminopeptidase
MKFFNQTQIIVAFAFMASLCVFSQSVSAQENLPKDYLTKEFHADRRAALRKLMPDNSVAVIFAYPDKVFSRDINFVYHPNPDLYYFSGYKETSAVLLIFKEMQHDSIGDYNELFFVQSRNPQREQWTGRRLGTEGVKNKLGFARAYESEDFEKFPVDLKKFNVLYDGIPNNTGNMKPVYDAFKQKSGAVDVDEDLLSDLKIINANATPSNLQRILIFLKPKLDDETHKNNSLIQHLVNKPDSAGIAEFKTKFKEQYGSIAAYAELTNKLRGVKTPEELELLAKSVKISCLAHAEVMRAINPSLSETELEGIFLYMHKKYGAEDEGYPPIVGSGANTCILHYEENDVTEVKNQLVLMDVGAEYHGYSADVTRTVPANGKFTDEQKAIYQIVYNAQEEIFKLCKEGTPFFDLNDKATEVLAAGLMKLGVIKTANEVSKYYPHGCSHHLGLDVHDKGSHGLLQENMTITVEPGIYIPEGSPCDRKWWNIGVRIEDDVVIGKEKCTLLSADAPRKWDDVEKMIAEKSFFDAVRPQSLK